MKSPKRQPPLYLLTGLILGLALGLVLSWLLFPARTVDTSPSDLRADYKEQYRAMIALAYASSGDVGRAQARLALLGDRDPVRQLASQAQLALLDQESQREARALAQLSSALEAVISSDVAQNLPQAYELVADAAYSLSEEQLLCADQDVQPQVKIFILDAEGNQQPDLAVTLNSASQQNDTLTGLREEYGPGYVEFALTPDEVYTLAVQGEVVLSGLQAAACEDEQNGWGSWLFTLQAK